MRITFFRDHRFIILDEPTAAIDPYEETKIYNRFAEISKNKSAIIVTHRLGSVKLADRIVVMKDGQVVQIGTHEELINKEGEYKRLYAAQENGIEKQLLMHRISVLTFTEHYAIVILFRIYK